MILGSSVVGFAAEEKATLITELSEMVLDDLEEDAYGGLYYEGDVLHIKPIVEAEVEAVLFSAQKKTRSVDKNIVIDEVAKYSYKELLNAQDKVSAQFENLGIYATGISSKFNSIRVIAEDEWTDEKKQAIYDIARIENVLFEVKKDGNALTPDRILEAEENFARALKPLAAGLRIKNRDSTINDRFTVGASAIMNGVEGYVTAGRYVSRGDRFEFTGQIIGTVIEAKNEGSVDFSFIERASGSEFYLTQEVELHPLDTIQHRGKITRSRNPVEGATVIIGATTGYRRDNIVDTSYRIDRPNGANSDLILFDSLSSGEGGDSGGPVLFDLGNENYAICGIWKGYAGTTDDEPLAIKFNNLRNLYDVQIY